MEMVGDENQAFSAGHPADLQNDRRCGHGGLEAMGEADRQVLDDALVLSERGLEYRAEISAEQVFGMIDLWQEWADEEGFEFDYEWATQCVCDQLEAGTLVPLVLWEAGKPVAVITITLWRDSFAGNLQAQLGQLFVAPHLRRGPVGMAFGRQGILVAEALGAKMIRIGALPERTNYYWRALPAGWKMGGTFFEREVF